MLKKKNCRRRKKKVERRMRKRKRESLEKWCLVRWWGCVCVREIIKKM